MAERRPRILFLAPRYPYPPWRGDQVRAFHLIAGLARHAEVSVIAIGDGERLPIEGVEVRSLQLGLGRRLRANLRVPPTMPLQTRLFIDTGLRRAVEEKIAEWQPDVVHVTLARMGWYLPQAGPFHRHLDFVDSLALNMRTRMAAHRGPARAAFSLEARLMLAYEARLAKLADSCSVVSEADRDVLGVARCAVIPNGVDVDAFSFVPPAAGPPVFLFFGNLGYFHNVEPARFLATQVLPLIRKREPDAILRLVGARPAAAVRALAEREGVELAADVPDMPAELRGASVAVLPSFSGSGVKNKVLEAFSSGLPVIANPLGVQGVEGALAGEHYLVAEGPEALAESVLELFGDVAARERLARAAHELILARYTWERQAERLLELYDAPAT